MAQTDFSNLFLNSEGRIGRQEFWIGSLIIMAVSGVLTTALYGQGMVWPGIFSLVGLMLFWPVWCLNIKRMHDRGKPVIWAIFYFLPFIGFFWWILDLWVLEGTKGPNFYGADPERLKARQAA